jgi:hypothetical protein
MEVDPPANAPNEPTDADNIAQPEAERTCRRFGFALASRDAR